MGDIRLMQFLLAFGGLTIVWLTHLHKSRMKNKELFSWRKYLWSNWVLILTCFISTLVLLPLTDILVDIGISLMGIPADTDTTNFDNFVALIGGLANLKIVEWILRKVTEKINTR